jgi:hypothetical protein
MLELILLAAVMAFIVSRIEARHAEEAKSPRGPDRAASPASPSDPALRPPLRLTIEGTQRPGILNNKFVKGFGVNPQRVADLRIYAHFGRYENFPDSIRKLLGELHLSGCAVGPGIMELMFHGRGLAEGEAVYFALVEDARDPHVVAFVDRLRLS